MNPHQITLLGSGVIVPPLYCTALKYETPMFQEFRTQNMTKVCPITVLFSIWVYVYALFLIFRFKKIPF